MDDSLIERIASGAAQGVRVSRMELLELQEAHQPGDSVELLKTDLANAAGHPDLHPAILSFLKNYPDREIRIAAAYHPTIGASERERLLGVEQAEADGRHALETPAFLASHVLDALALSPDAAIRAKCMSAWDTNAGHAALLVDDPEPTVRAAVAKWPKTPVDLLVRLAADPQELVVVAVSGNHNTPSYVLKSLYGQVPDWALAGNPSTPQATLAQIAAGAGIESGWEQPDRPRWQCPEPPNIDLQLCRNRSTPADVLMALFAGARHGQGGRAELLQREPARRCHTRRGD